MLMWNKRLESSSGDHECQDILHQFNLEYCYFMYKNLFHLQKQAQKWVAAVCTFICSHELLHPPVSPPAVILVQILSELGSDQIQNNWVCTTSPLSLSENRINNSSIKCLILNLLTVCRFTLVTCPTRESWASVSWPGEYIYSNYVCVCVIDTES